MMLKPIVRADEWDWRSKRDKSVAPSKIIRALDTEVRALEGNARSFEFTISTASVDRYGDTVAVDGWKLENFRKNPVVLWMHNNSMLPVAAASHIRVEEGKLKARATFEAEGLIAFNDHVFRMLTTSMLRATSVGFLPLKYAFVDDPTRRFGIDFHEQELLEFSIVTVPANPEALSEGRDFVPEPAPPEEPPADIGGMSLDLAQHCIRTLRLRAA
jgi:HK97 family phage prohead protease